MGLRSAAPASPVISAGVARAAAPGPLPLARAPSQTPVTAYWRRLLACVLTRLLVRNDEFAVLLDRGVAAGGAAAAAPGPARTPPAGFRRTGQDRQRGVKSAKAPPATRPSLGCSPDHACTTTCPYRSSVVASAATGAGQVAGSWQANRCPCLRGRPVVPGGRWGGSA